MSQRLRLSRIPWCEVSGGGRRDGVRRIRTPSLYVGGARLKKRSICGLYGWLGATFHFDIIGIG